MAKAEKSRKAAAKKAASARAEPLAGGKGTKEQMAVPAAYATQIDASDEPDKYTPGDDELVADPETRGWVTHGQIKERMKKAADADKAHGEKSQANAAKDKKAAEGKPATPHGEPVPEEVAEHRKDEQKAAEQTVVVPKETNTKVVVKETK